MVDHSEAAMELEADVTTSGSGSNKSANLTTTTTTTTATTSTCSKSAKDSPPPSSLLRPSRIGRSLYDLRYLVGDVREVIALALRRSLGGGASRRTELRFWTSWQAHSVYACVGLAALTGFWQPFLALGALVLVLQINWIVLKWAYYIRDDSQVDFFIDFCTTWIKRVLREGEKVLKGRDAVSYVMAFSVVRAAPTGFLYARYIVRYNMRKANAQVLMEAAERFGTLMEPKAETIVGVGDENDNGTGNRSMGSNTISRITDASMSGKNSSRKAQPPAATVMTSIVGGQHRARQFTASLAFGQSRSFDYAVYDMPIEMDLNGIIVDDAVPKRLRATITERIRPKG
jgi:hypothetical protein